MNRRKNEGRGQRDEGGKNLTRLSHITADGKARMVDITHKGSSLRQATAESFVSLSDATLAQISEGSLPKGNALEVARLAGIQGAKRTPDLIPLCHPLLLTHVDVNTEILERGVRFVATVSCTGQTGVEMEALVAASTAALTLYDMVKAVEKDATIERVRLLEKSGGKSGAFRRNVRQDARQ